MLLLPVFAHFAVQAADGTGVYFDQTGRALDTTAIGQVCGRRDSFRLWYFAIPQCRIFPFAEFLLAATTAQIANLVTAVYFTNEQVCAPVMTIQVAVGVDTC